MELKVKSKSLKRLELRFKLLDEFSALPCEIQVFSNKYAVRWMLFEYLLPYVKLGFFVGFHCCRDKDSVPYDDVLLLVGH